MIKWIQRLVKNAPIFLTNISLLNIIKLPWKVFVLMMLTLVASLVVTLTSLKQMVLKYKLWRHIAFITLTGIMILLLNHWLDIVWDFNIVWAKALEFFEIEVMQDGIWLVLGLLLLVYVIINRKLAKNNKVINKPQNISFLYLKYEELLEMVLNTTLIIVVYKVLLYFIPQTAQILVDIRIYFIYPLLILAIIYIFFRNIYRLKQILANLRKGKYNPKIYQVLNFIMTVNSLFIFLPLETRMSIWMIAFFYRFLSLNLHMLKYGRAQKDRHKSVKFLWDYAWIGSIFIFALDKIYNAKFKAYLLQIKEQNKGKLALKIKKLNLRFFIEDSEAEDLMFVGMIKKHINKKWVINLVCWHFVVYKEVTEKTKFVNILINLRTREEKKKEDKNP